MELLSPDFDDDEFPVETLFRDINDMPEIEQTALKLAKYGGKNKTYKTISPQTAKNHTLTL